MLTNNIINGYEIPENARYVEDYPREIQIGTVDFVYQRIAFMMYSCDKDSFVLQKAREQSDLFKYKKRILTSKNDISFISRGKNSTIDAMLDILAYLVKISDKKDKWFNDAVADFMEHHIVDGMIESFDLSQTTERGIALGIKTALDIFCAAGERDGKKISHLVDTLTRTDNSEIDKMYVFVKDAIGDLWDCKTLGDLIITGMRNGTQSQCKEMPELASFFDGTMRPSFCENVSYDAGARPKINYSIAAFRLSSNLGINNDDIYHFTITDEIKHKICSVMQKSCTHDSDKLTHGVSVDRGFYDTYLSLVWEYAIASYADKQFRKGVLARCSYKQKEDSLKSKELSTQKKAEELERRESEVEKLCLKHSANVDSAKLTEEFYEFKKSSLKRENALKDRLEQTQRRVDELERLLANAERELISFRPDEEIPEIETTEEETVVEAIDYHKALTEIADKKKIVFVGGHQNYINSLKSAQPHISYIDGDDIASCDSLIRNADVVVFRTTQMSHSLYNKVKNICQTQNVRFEYLAGVTSIYLTEELIVKLLQKEANS